MLEQATFHHRTNSILLCLLGLNAFVPNPNSNVLLNQSMMRRKLPHLFAFGLLVNAIIFQSYSLYAIVISRDYKYAGEISEMAQIGEAMQVGGAAAMVLAAL